MAARRDAVVEEWLREVATPATARFLRQPLSAIVDGVLDDDPGLAAGAVEEIVRLHAVQELRASQAVSFLPHLKKLLCQEDGAGASVELDERVDRLVLVAFDSYVACRERLWEIKWNERNRRTWLLDRLEASEDGTRHPAPGMTPRIPRS